MPGVKLDDTSARYDASAPEIQTDGGDWQPAPPQSPPSYGSATAMSTTTAALSAWAIRRSMVTGTVT
jgi:hypothetical protein